MFSPFLQKWLGVELVEVSAKEKLVAALGGGLAMFLLITLTTQALPLTAAAAIIGSMGASAVLLFGMPHGALSQPWPVLAGHVGSAVIGVTCARMIPHTALAASAAVGLAIGMMHLGKCIHPPGGATAFAAVMGGDAVRALGYRFVLFPVLLNAVVMVLLAVAINRFFPWRRYPAIRNRPAQPPPSSAAPEPGPTHEEVLAAVRRLDSFVDITEEDLVRLTQILAPRRPVPAGKSAPPAARFPL